MYQTPIAEKILFESPDVLNADFLLITSTKNVVNNYTSLSTGAKTLGTMKFGLFSYATLYYAKKQVSANTTLFDAYFCQLKKGNSNTNVFFVGAGAATDNGMRWNTYYYTDADGNEQSFETYYGGIPAHVQEMTVSCLGDAVATDSGVAVSYRVHWQFYPTRVSSTTHSSHSTSGAQVEAAHAAATEPPAFPEEYQRSSVGQ